MSANKYCQSFLLMADLRLESPMIIGNGVNEHSDNDLLLDSEGRPFIPGSSLAGVIKSGLKNTTQISEKDLNLLLGEEGVDSRQSMVIVNDCFLKKESKSEIVIRDGIEINEYTKTAKNKSKYDFEVLNSGCVFQFKMEIVTREKFKHLPVLQFVSDFLAYAENGDFRIGAKTSRGYGQVSLKNTSYQHIDFMDEKKWKNPVEAIKFYADFQWDNLKGGVQDASLPPARYRSPYTMLEIPLEVESTLFIRSYFLSNFDVDAEQLMANGKAVIPGSAWAGCFRHKAKEFLYELADKSCAQEMTKEIFGAEKEDEDAASSRIIFFESEDLCEQTLTKDVTRNKIDRFTGGALKTALFSERIAVGGNYILKIKLKDAKPYEIGLLLLVVQEIRHGLMAVGGTTSVGRGEFRGTDKNAKELPVRVDGKLIDKNKMASYWKSLSEKLGV